MYTCIRVRLIESQIKGGKEIIVWQPTPIVSALSLENVRIVLCCKVHKRPKTAVAFKTSIFLAKPKGTPLFTGDVFQKARLCNEHGPTLGVRFKEVSVLKRVKEYD